MSASWETTSSIADRASVTTQQAGTCLARLTKLGLVAKGDVHASGLRQLERVEVKPAIGVGDRVRVKSGAHRGTVFVVEGTNPITTWGKEVDGPRRCDFYTENVERLPDADPVPWDPPKPAVFAVGDRVQWDGNANDCGVIDRVDGTSLLVRDDSDRWRVWTAHLCQPAPPKPKPIAWAQQTRPVIPWHLKTPMQQRGVAP